MNYEHPADAGSVCKTVPPKDIILRPHIKDTLIMCIFVSDVPQQKLCSHVIAKTNLHSV